MTFPTVATRSLSCRSGGCPFPARYWATTQMRSEGSGEWLPPNHMAWCAGCTHRMADILITRLNSEGWLSFTVEPIEGLEYTFTAIARMTEAQRETIDKLFTNFRARHMSVATAFDLGQGFVSFYLSYGRRSWLYGGIEPNGHAHT